MDEMGMTTGRDGSWKTRQGLWYRVVGVGVGGWVVGRRMRKKIIASIYMSFVFLYYFGGFSKQWGWGVVLLLLLLLAGCLGLVWSKGWTCTFAFSCLHGRKARGNGRRKGSA